MLPQSLLALTSLARLFINPEFHQCPLRDSCQLQLFSVVSACNWVSHSALNIMVLRCMHYITPITLNVSQAEPAVATRLVFEPDSTGSASRISNHWAKRAGLSQVVQHVHVTTSDGKYRLISILLIQLSISIDKYRYFPFVIFLADMFAL